MSCLLKHLLPLLLLLGSWQAYAQTEGVVLLKNKLNSSTISKDSAANICRQLTRIYAQQRNPQEALLYTIREIKLLGNPESIKHAEVYFNIASLNRAMAQYSKALEYANRAEELYHKELGKHHPERLSLLKFLAQTHYLMEDYSKASSYADQALAGYTNLKERNPRAEIELEILMGSIHTKKANYQAAQSSFLGALLLYEKFEKALSVKLLTRIYNNLASVKIEQRAILEALSYYQKIASIRIELHHPNHYSLQKTYSNIGLCYYKLGTFEKALNYHRKSLLISYQTYGDEHDLVAFCHNHIGGTFQMLDQVDSARFHLLKAVTIYREVLGNSSPKSIAPLWRLAKLFRKEKAYIKSQVSLEKTIFIQQLHFGNYHPDLAKMYLDMAYLYEEQDAFVKASFYANQAFEANRPHQRPLDKGLMLGIIEAQLRIGLMLSEKDQKNAFQLLDFIPPTVALAQANLHYTSDKQKLIQGLRKVCESGIELCYQLYKKQPETVYLKKVFELMEFNKAVLLSIQIKQSYLKNQEENSSDVQQKLLGEIHFLEQQWKSSEYHQDSAKALQIQQKLFDHYQQYEALFQTKNKQLDYHSPIDLTALQKELSIEQVVVSYYYGNQHLYILCIEQEKVELLQVSLDFETTLTTFSDYLLNLDKCKINLSQSCIAFDQAAHDLYQYLLPQLKTQTLVIPDRQLSYLPFEALTTGKSSSPKGYHQLHYVLYQSRISYAYSATSFYYQQYKHLNSRDAQILAFAPTFEGTNRLQKLNANQAEVKLLQEKYQGAFYYKKQATKVEFQQQAADFTILHLATHAFADNHELQQARLFFYGKDSLSATLFPHEIIQIPLKADFVCLSACQTAIGYWQEGEGIMSLARDFMFAGVPSILTTLWQVNDQSSSLIVKAFYKKLKGLPKDEALQWAKKNYLQRASAFEAHPYFWSGYILLGNTNRLDMDAGSSINLYYFVAFFFIIIVLIGYRLKNSLFNNSK